MPHVPVVLSLTRSRNQQNGFSSCPNSTSLNSQFPTNPSSLRLLRHSLISQNAPSSLHFPLLFSPMNSSAATTLSHRKKAQIDGAKMAAKRVANGNGKAYSVYGFDPSFMRWTARDAVNVVRVHWLPCFFAVNLLFFMAVEYTLRMVPASSPPFDLGFLATDSLHRLLSSWPELNTLLAALNTVFVGMQTAYILWTWLVEGRPRATISALFMFTCRGILGYSTQLPVPKEFLGSGVDFPVGNVSFFLFFSGHVAGSIIASLDMRRMQRWELAWTFDVLNVLQVVRLLGTRGHYTIDLAAGVGAGILFDLLAGKYEELKKNEKLSAKEALLS